MNVIELRGIFKSFGTKEVLKDISLTISKGEFLAIKGASGSGKSTLLNIIGLLDFPQKGKFFWRGKELKVREKTVHSKIRNTDIGFIFQSYNLLDEYTARENILLPLLYHKPSNHNNIFDNLCKRLDLSSILDAKAKVLSGGEKQRVAIARALINEPSVIICDEPTGNLDLENAKKVIKVLQEENRKGKTIIFVTHSSDFDTVYSRVVKVENGGLISC